MLLLAIKLFPRLVILALKEEIFADSLLRSEIPEVKMPQKILFNREIKSAAKRSFSTIVRKKRLKTHLLKSNATTMHGLCFAFLKPRKLEMSLHKQDFHILMKGKIGSGNL